ncbi:MAG: hypothetical protein WCB11_06335 [Terriglobales bacterium]
MADDLAAIMRQQDKGILISIVDDIGPQLKLIVFEKKHIFRSEYQKYFPGPWRDVEERLSRARTALEKDDFNWDYVEGAGLVRDSLRFKRDMLTQAIKQGVVSRLLKIVNSVLGSLSHVFPFLEAVKEYKEHAEAAISVQNRWE